jgi:hypothetical protein
LPALWAGGRLSPAQQKEVLRSLIRHVVLTRTAPDALAVRIVWVSGAVSPLTVRVPAAASRALPTYDELAARVLALAATGLTDRAIAARLTAEGYRSARREAVALDLVRTIRQEAGLSPSVTNRGQERVDGPWTVRGLAARLGVSGDRVLARIRAGRLPATRHPVTGHYLVADEPALLDRLREEVAAGRRSCEKAPL